MLGLNTSNNANRFPNKDKNKRCPNILKFRHFISNQEQSTAVMFSEQSYGVGISRPVDSQVNTARAKIFFLL